MALINLLDKYHDSLVTMYGRDSYTANVANTNYEFKGVKGLELLNMIPMDVNSGYMSNGSPRSGAWRLGTPGEVTDAMQYLEMEKDLYWTNTIDSADNSQQGYLKRAGAYMKLMMRTKQNPYKDKYILAKWARNAGKVVSLASGGTVDKSNIVEKLCDIEEYFEDAGVPEDNRSVFLPIKHWTYLRLADEYDACDTLKRDLTFKGWKGNFNTLRLIFVPNDYMPANVEFIAVQKDSIIAPSTFKHVQIYEKAPGFVGPLMEYLEYFDAFVIGALNAGVYVLVDYGYKMGNLTITAGQSTTTITYSSGDEVYYTLDGTDPKWSKTRLQYTAAFTNPASGTLIRAVAKKDSAGKYWSDEKTATAA